MLYTVLCLIKKFDLVNNILVHCVMWLRPMVHNDLISLHSLSWYHGTTNNLGFNIKDSLYKVVKKKLMFHTGLKPPERATTMVFWAKNQRWAVTFWPKVVQDKWSQRTVLDLPLWVTVHYWLKQVFFSFPKTQRLNITLDSTYPEFSPSCPAVLLNVSLKRLAIFTLAKPYSCRIVGILGTCISSILDSLICLSDTLCIEPGSGMLKKSFSEIF